MEAIGLLKKPFDVKFFVNEIYVNSCEAESAC